MELQKAKAEDTDFAFCPENTSQLQRFLFHTYVAPNFFHISKREGLEMTQGEEMYLCPQNTKLVIITTSIIIIIILLLINNMTILMIRLHGQCEKDK